MKQETFTIIYDGLSIMQYFIVHSYSYGGNADRSWREKNVVHFLCGRYDHWDKFYSSILIDMDNFDSKYAMGSISMPKTLFFRYDLFKILSPEIVQAKQSQLGVLVNGQTGQVMPEWKTYWMPSIRIRGDNNTDYWKCEMCNNYIYPSSARCEYLVEAEVADRALLLANNFLVLREDIYTRLIQHSDWKTMRNKLRFSKMKILKKPIDGYPEDLSQFEPKTRNLMKSK